MNKSYTTCGKVGGIEMQALLFKCPMCGSGTNLDVEHERFVVDGEAVCHRTLCQERAMSLLQGREKVQELGIGFNPEAFQLPLRLESP